MLVDSTIDGLADAHEEAIQNIQNARTSSIAGGNAVEVTSKEGRSSAKTSVSSRNHGDVAN